MRQLGIPFEEWRPVPGWEDWYAISSHGRAKAFARFRTTKKGGRSFPERILKLESFAEGSLFLCVVDKDKRERLTLAHLVLEAFVGPRQFGQEVGYADGSRSNCRVENLSWRFVGEVPAQTERWLPVVGLEGCYEVSDRGRIRSVPRTMHRSDGREHRVRSRVMKQQTNAYGYLMVTLFEAGKQHMKAVHRAVLEAFAGPCPDGMECRHLNGNKKDARLENLAWGTPKENGQDRVRHGTSQLSAAATRVLTDDQVREMRALRRSGMTYKAISDRFGVAQMTAWHACTGRTYKHISG